MHVHLVELARRQRDLVAAWQLLDAGYHRFKDEDERKQLGWERAGYTVRRISSHDVYGAPHKLIELAT